MAGEVEEIPMEVTSYHAASVPVREDLAAAHARFWRRLERFLAEKTQG